MTSPETTAPTTSGWYSVGRCGSSGDYSRHGRLLHRRSNHYEIHRSVRLECSRRDPTPYGLAPDGGGGYPLGAFDGVRQPRAEPGYPGGDRHDTHGGHG